MNTYRPEDILKGFFGLTVKDAKPSTHSNELDPFSQLIQANQNRQQRERQEDKTNPTTTSKGK